jgi:hypothetical protein
LFRTLSPERSERLVGDETPLRVVTTPFRANGENYYLQAAVRDRLLEDLLGPLDLAVLGAPLIAAAIASWLIGGRAVAPIQRLSRAGTRALAALVQRALQDAQHRRRDRAPRGRAELGARAPGGRLPRAGAVHLQRVARAEDADRRAPDRGAGRQARGPRTPSAARPSSTWPNAR